MAGQKSLPFEFGSNPRTSPTCFCVRAVFPVAFHGERFERKTLRVGVSGARQSPRYFIRDFERQNHVLACRASYFHPVRSFRVGVVRFRVIDGGRRILTAGIGHPSPQSFPHTRSRQTCWGAFLPLDHQLEKTVQSQHVGCPRFVPKLLHHFREEKIFGPTPLTLYLPPPSRRIGQALIDRDVLVN